MKLVTSFVHIVLYIPIERSIDRSMDIIHMIWPLWNPPYAFYEVSYSYPDVFLKNNAIIYYHVWDSVVSNYF